MASGSPEKVTLAIIGAGAVTEELYCPALRLADNLAVTHMVDLDQARAKAVAERFQIPHAVQDYRAVFGKVDAVLVATPPGSHAPIAIACMHEGLHVLCEKPLTTTVEAAQSMIAAAKETQTHLAVGMVRRLSRTSELLSTLMQTGMLGTLERFEAEEGYEFRWPLRTGHIFQDNRAGGVLVDTGTHVIDLALWSLAGQAARLVSYRDDSWGGVAANAEVACEVETATGWTPGVITLSFTRPLGNRLRIYGNNGWIEAPTLAGGGEIVFHPAQAETGPLVIKPQQAPRPRKLIEQFGMQLARFAAAIQGAPAAYVRAEEALATIALIEACQQSRTMMVQPWEARGLEAFFGGQPHER